MQRLPRARHVPPIRRPYSFRIACHCLVFVSYSAYSFGEFAAKRVELRELEKRREEKRREGGENKTTLLECRAVL
jgi:hypothetical protein